MLRNLDLRLLSRLASPACQKGGMLFQTYQSIRNHVRPTRRPQKIFLLRAMNPERGGGGGLVVVVVSCCCSQLLLKLLLKMPVAVQSLHYISTGSKYPVRLFKGSSESEVLT